MTAQDLQTLAQLLTGQLLNTAAEGTVLVAAVWLLLRLVGQQNSGTRFAIWFTALAGVVTLPFLAGSGLGATHSRPLSAANLHNEILLPSSWAFYLFAAWVVGAGLLVLRLSVGLWRVCQIRRRCSTVELASLDPAAVEIFRGLVSSRRVQLCVSNDVAVPAAIGFFRPAIIFPAWLLPQLSTGEIKVILLHELAHLRRWDDWTNLAQKIAKAVFFFHPAVWWIENRLTLEREMACDDIVLTQTPSPKDYASSLISFAEKLHYARGLALAQALVSRMRHMSLRVTQILDAERRGHSGFWKPVLGVSTGMLALVLTTAPYAPRFVGFENQGKPSQTQQIEATNQASEHETQPEAGSRPRVIPAGLTLRRSAVRLQSEAGLRGKATVMRAIAQERQRLSQETVVIVQTTQFDASGSGVWTLCVWKVEKRNSSERRLESDMVLDSL